MQADQAIILLSEFLNVDAAEVREPDSIIADTALYQSGWGRHDLLMEVSEEGTVSLVDFQRKYKVVLTGLVGVALAKAFLAITAEQRGGREDHNTASLAKRLECILSELRVLADETARLIDQTVALAGGAPRARAL